MDKALVVTVWPKEGNDPEEEGLEATVTGAYMADEGEEPDPSDHIQFGTDLADGRSLEIRLPSAWLTKEAIAILLDQ